MNKVILIGNLGSDPEKKEKCTKFSLATSDKWKDKEGEQQEKTEWHQIVCFGKLADTTAEYLKKGRKVAVEGKISYSKYEKDGQTRYSTSIVANNVLFLTSEKQEAKTEMPETELPF